MSMLAEKFINRLEQQGLLEEEIVNKLRRKISKAKNQHRITAEHIAKLLVDAGHLTQFQATKLVAEFSAPKANAVTEVGATQEVNPSGELGFKPSEEKEKAELKLKRTRDQFTSI